MYIVGCYMSYLLISLAITVWVARTLHKNGRVFLVDTFHGNAELAELGGMHFFNLFIFSRMRKRSRLDSSREVAFANPAPRA